MHDSAGEAGFPPTLEMMCPINPFFRKFLQMEMGVYEFYCTLLIRKKAFPLVRKCLSSVVKRSFYRLPPLAPECLLGKLKMGCDGDADAGDGVDFTAGP